MQIIKRTIKSNEDKKGIKSISYNNNGILTIALNELEDDHKKKTGEQILLNLLPSEVEELVKFLRRIEIR